MFALTIQAGGMTSLEVQDACRVSMLKFSLSGLSKESVTGWCCFRVKKLC